MKAFNKRKINKPSSPNSQKMNINELVQLFFHHMVLLAHQYSIHYGTVHLSAVTAHRNSITQLLIASHVIYRN